MGRGKASGYKLTKSDAAIVLGMVARGDRDHDIAGWFGVNQGRIAEVKEGKFGSVPIASTGELPPKGPPGIKGQRLRSALDKAIDSLESSKSSDEALTILKKARAKYDAPEA